MKFNNDELFILQEVIDYHCDLVLNDEDDHGVYQVHTLYKLVKLMRSTLDCILYIMYVEVL